MSFTLHHRVEIAAPVERVWEVIADLDRYPEWNPFVVAARSTLAVGDPISMRVRLLPFLVQPQRETILECVPGERLCYGLAGVKGGLLRSRRCHLLRALTPERSEYRSDFELSGRLVPIVRGLLGGRLTVGFASNTQAVADRAEALERARSSEPGGD